MKRYRWIGAIVATALLAACGSSASKSSSNTTTATGGTTGGTTASSTGSSGTSSSGTSSSSTKYPAIPAGPIVFGVSAPLSGAVAAFGLTTEASFTKVTIPAFNAEFPNGIAGHPIVLKFLDDASDVTKAVSVANQLVADKAAAVLTASYNPEAAAQQYAVWNKAHMPVVSTLTGTQYANTSTYPWFFGIGPSVQQEGMAAAQYIAKKGFTKIATISDGVPQDTDALNAITSAMKTVAPNASVVKAVTIPPGAVDDSAAVAQLKGANPDLLVVYLGFGYGPLWSAMRASNWSPQILATAGAWYDGFNGMGPLATKAVAPYYDCASSASQTFPADIASLMAKYSAATGAGFTNYLTFVNTDTVALLLLKYAIEKYNTLDPVAIKAALEGINNQSFDGITYTYSPTNHYGVTGQYAGAVCNMAPPYAGGVAKVPVKSS